MPDKPLTVAFLGLRGFPQVQGGVETHAEHLCPILAELGCNVEVFVRSPYMTLNEGDRIIALDGSRAAVVYPDGCVTQIKENSLLALEKGAGCNKEPVRTGGTREPLRYAQAIGQSSDAAPPPVGGGSGAPIVVPSAGASGLGFGGVGVGGLLFGGLVIGGIAIDNRHNQPISPH